MPRAVRATDTRLIGLERETWRGFASLLALSAVAYIPAILGSYVWDDLAIHRNPLVRTPGGIVDIWLRPARQPLEVHYWPMVYTSYWIEARVAGLHAPVSHAINVALHAAICAALWRLLRRGKIPGAFFAAAIFALHPVHVEGVAWAIERKGLIAALFYFASFWKFLDARESKAGGVAWRAALAFFVAAMLSKSIVITLPVALALWIWMIDGSLPARDLRRLATLLAAGFGMAVADSIFAARFELQEEVELAVAARPALAARVLAFYFSKLILPIGLGPIYPAWTPLPLDPRGWMAAAVAAAGLAGLWLARGKVGRGPFVAAAFYVVTLAPVLGLVTHSFMLTAYAADRYQYLASAAPIALFAALADRAMASFAPAARRTMAGGLLLALGAMTFHQGKFYASESALWRRALEVNPGSARAKLNLAAALGAEGKAEEARALAADVLRVDPSSDRARIALAASWTMEGKPDEALKALDLDATLAKSPHPDRLLLAAGEAFAAKGDGARAAELMREALARKPGAEDVQLALAGELVRLGQLDEATRALGLVLQKNPRNARAHHALGVAMQMRGNLGAAGESFERAIAIDPEYAEALGALGAVVAQLGDAKRGHALLERALALDPRNAQTRANMGSLLGALGRSAEAITHLEEAVRLDPASAQNLIALGMELAAAGRIGLARERLEQAVKLAPNAPEAHHNLGILAARQGEMKRAAECFAEAVRLAPDYQEARENLARAQAALAGQPAR